MTKSNFSLNGFPHFLHLNCRQLISKNTGFSPMVNLSLRFDGFDVIYDFLSRNNGNDFLWISQLVTLFQFPVVDGSEITLIPSMFRIYVRTLVPFFVAMTVILSKKYW